MAPQSAGICKPDAASGGGAWNIAASTDVDAALSAVPVVDQNGFIITPSGSGPGVPSASWHHDYTKEAQRLKKWRAMLGAPARTWPRLGALGVAPDKMARHAAHVCPALAPRWRANPPCGSLLQAAWTCKKGGRSREVSARARAPGAGTADWKRFVARHPSTVKRRVRKGIPDRLRGLAWQLLSGGRDLLMQNEGAGPAAPVPGQWRHSPISERSLEEQEIPWGTPSPSARVKRGGRNTGVLRPTATHPEQPPAHASSADR